LSRPPSAATVRRSSSASSARARAESPMGQVPTCGYPITRQRSTTGISVTGPSTQPYRVPYTRKEVVQSLYTSWTREVAAG
jgi:hypothetical protein